MESKVYVLGSINTDMAITSERLPEQGETIVGSDFAESLGGKGCNQAVAAAKLGIPTIMIGAVGDDIHGQNALTSLASDGVQTAYIERTKDAHTGVAMILRVANDNRIILNQGANGEVSVQQVETGLAQATAEDFLLTQFEIPLHIVLAGLKEAKAKGVTTVVNPAPALKVGDETLEQIDIIVLNQMESQELTGIYPETQIDVEEIAAWFFTKGIKLVVVTLGGGGSFAVNKDITIFTPAYNVDVVDTTGAGDAFIGTMLYYLSQKTDVSEAMQYASAAGALACTREGAQTALPTLRELQEFIKEKE